MSETTLRQMLERGSQRDDLTQGDVFLLARALLPIAIVDHLRAENATVIATLGVVRRAVASWTEPGWVPVARDDETLCPWAYSHGDMTLRCSMPRGHEGYHRDDLRLLGWLDGELGITQLEPWPWPAYPALPEATAETAV